MRPFTWKNDYSVGNATLDEQHKTIFNLINLLVDGNNSDFDEILYNFTMAELRNYIEWHLHYEEQIMKSVGYPDLDNHMQSHVSFIENIEELTVAFDDISPAFKANLINYLKDWLSNHILVEDMKYKPYLETV